MPSMGDHSFSGHGDTAGTAVGFLLHRKSIGKQLEIRLSLSIMLTSVLKVGTAGGTVQGVEKGWH